LTISTRLDYEKFVECLGKTSCRNAFKKVIILNFLINFLINFLFALLGRAVAESRDNSVDAGVIDRARGRSGLLDIKFAIRR